jgi:hypothetical protein
MTFEERFAEMWLDDARRATLRAERGEKPWFQMTKGEQLMSFMKEVFIPNILADGAMVTIWILSLLLVVMTWVSLRPDWFAAFVEWLRAMPK